MTEDTIRKLNQLNQHFYQTTADSFDRSRQYFWQGWQQLQPFLDQLVESSKPGKQLAMLDLGCGNARFAQFLAQETSLNFSYTGVDNSQQLLARARKRLEKLDLDHKFLNLDIVESLLADQLAVQISGLHELIVVFGVIHHIPSSNLRSQLLTSLAALLKPQGRAVITAWQFANKARFDDKIVPPQTAGLEPGDLEENDYILDWKRGKQAYRYCHYASSSELKQLAADQPGLSLIKQFTADGKSHDLNLYTVLEKSEPV